MRYFKETFADVIDWHIAHTYSAEMSEVVSTFNYDNYVTFVMHLLQLQIPLGVLMKNENKYSEMIDIMTHFHQYVPLLQGATSSDPDVPISNLPNKETLHPLLFGGDQLTVARARGCQELRLKSDTATGHLHGLLPTAEDWHTLVTPCSKNCVCMISCTQHKLHPCRSNMYIHYGN